MALLYSTTKVTTLLLEELQMLGFVDHSLVGNGKNPQSLWSASMKLIHSIGTSDLNSLMER